MLPSPNQQVLCREASGFNCWCLIHEIPLVTSWNSLVQVLYPILYKRFYRSQVVIAGFLPCNNRFILFTTRRLSKKKNSRFHQKWTPCCLREILIFIYSCISVYINIYNIGKSKKSLFIDSELQPYHLLKSNKRQRSGQGGVSDRCLGCDQKIAPQFKWYTWLKFTEFSLKLIAPTCQEAELQKEKCIVFQPSKSQGEIDSLRKGKSSQLRWGCFLFPSYVAQNLFHQQYSSWLKSRLSASPIIYMKSWLGLL